MNKDKIIKRLFNIRQSKWTFLQKHKKDTGMTVFGVIDILLEDYIRKVKSGKK